MAEYTLHCFAQSGNSYKAALMLRLCGLAWTPVLVDYFNGETRSDTYRREINAFGEAPVLSCHGGRIAQSGAILTYLSEATGRFAPEAAADRIEVLSWLLFDNHKFTSSIASLRYLVAIMKTGETPVTAFMRTRAEGAIGILEAHLAGRDFVACGRPTIADLSLCGYLFYKEEYGLDWNAFPAIGAWKRRIAGLPGFALPSDLMPDAPLPAAA